MAAGRNLAYTSAATILRILEQKKIRREHKERQDVHLPGPAEQRHLPVPIFEKICLRKLFDNTPASLVARLVDDYDFVKGNFG